MKNYFFQIIFILLILQGCGDNTSKDLTEQEKAAISNEVEASVEDYRNAFLNLDGDSMIDFNANVDEYTYAGDGGFIGYEEYAEQIKQFVETTKDVNYIEIDDANIIVLARDAASYAIKYRWSINAVTGDTINAVGSWVYVLKKYNEKWRLVHSVGSHIYN